MPPHVRYAYKNHTMLRAKSSACWLLGARTSSLEELFRHVGVPRSVTKMKCPHGLTAIQLGAFMKKSRVSPERTLVSEEITLNWNSWVRQFHRWLSIAFTVTVIANFVAMSLGEPPAWVVYSPLLPLFLLLFTGLYMFVLPYAAKRHSTRGA